MKIAIVTDDGRTVSRHFGRAAHYAVLTVEDGSIVGRELRDKFSPHAMGMGEAHADLPGYAHGTDPAAQSRHNQMAAAIADCDVLLCGGMGMGAYQSMAANGIRPVVTDIEDVETAAIECAAGRIVDHVDKLH